MNLCLVFLLLANSIIMLLFSDLLSLHMQRPQILTNLKKHILNAMVTENVEVLYLTNFCFYQKIYINISHIYIIALFWF